MAVLAEATFAVPTRVSDAADHDLPVAQAVAGVGVGQTTLPHQLCGLHDLKEQNQMLSRGTSSSTPEVVQRGTSSPKPDVLQFNTSQCL